MGAGAIHKLLLPGRSKNLVWGQGPNVALSPRGQVPSYDVVRWLQ